MSKQAEVAEILERAYNIAESRRGKSIVKDGQIIKRVSTVCQCEANRACIRLLMSCLLVKINDDTKDVRKPYTEIGGEDCFSGRTYDELYVGDMIQEHKLPCNSTTAYLTPAFRNQKEPLLVGMDLVGRPKRVYDAALQLLDDVQSKRVSAEDLLTEVMIWLIKVREENEKEIQLLVQSIKQSQKELDLSSEEIVTLLKQHLACKNSSRLPVLIVAAAYQAASKNLGERSLPLASHNAADKQTGALGDIEITLVDDDNIITSYEMKDKKVTKGDIIQALEKIKNSESNIQHYIFITTDTIDPEIEEYVKTLYEATGGIEFVILDCIGFIRHFLHLFHRLRTQFLDEYQELVLNEKESAVGQPLKVALLALRRAAESSTNGKVCGGMTG